MKLSSLTLITPEISSDFGARITGSDHPTPLSRSPTFSSSVFSSPLEWPLLGTFPPSGEAAAAASAAPSFLDGLSDSGASCVDYDFNISDIKFSDPEEGCNASEHGLGLLTWNTVSTSFGRFLGSRLIFAGAASSLSSNQSAGPMAEESPVVSGKMSAW